MLPDSPLFAHRAKGRRHGSAIVWPDVILNDVGLGRFARSFARHRRLHPFRLETPKMHSGSNPRHVAKKLFLSQSHAIGAIVICSATASE